MIFDYFKEPNFELGFECTYNDIREEDEEEESQENEDEDEEEENEINDEENSS